MLSGYATFPTETSLPEKIGEVRNVYGKKAAKEEVARGLWEVLTALAADRGVSIEERDGDNVGGHSVEGSQ